MSFKWNENIWWFFFVSKYFLNFEKSMITFLAIICKNIKLKFYYLSVKQNLRAQGKKKNIVSFSVNMLISLYTGNKYFSMCFISVICKINDPIYIYGLYYICYFFFTKKSTCKQLDHRIWTALKTSKSRFFSWFKKPISRTKFLWYQIK